MKSDRNNTESVSSKKYKILIVDDAPSIVAAISDMLKSDYTVAAAYSGEEALPLIRKFRPDIILLDITMPGIDGYEVCRYIRSNGMLEFIKIVMVSSRSMLDERLKGYDVGADDYIVKPFKADELLAKIRVFTRLKSVEDQLKALNAKLNEQVRLRTEQLMNAEKMAALGRYTAGIIHNLNNPLQAIMGNAELLAIRQPDNQNIMHLRKAAAQMKKIISTILSTGYRESNAEYTDIDMNEVLRDQIELLRANPFFKHEIETRMSLAPLPAYRGLYLHFSQSFGNLIKNAAEAMYESSVKTLSVESSVRNKTIIICIADTGHGIPRDRLSKIFDPFYTTKPLTARDRRPTGTGLGLASAKEMIEAYGGKIAVSSQIGRGTVFTVSLPVTGS